MISKRTLKDTLDVIEKWSGENALLMEDVMELLRRISQVPGNMSFRDSVAALVAGAKERERRGGQ